MARPIRATRSGIATWKVRSEYLSEVYARAKARIAASKAGGQIKRSVSVFGSRSDFGNRCSDLMMVGR